MTMKRTIILLWCLNDFRLQCLIVSGASSWACVTGPLSLILLTPAKKDYSRDRRLHYEQFFCFHSESVGLVVFQVYSILFQ